MRNMFTTSILLIVLYFGFSTFSQKEKEKQQAYITVIDQIANEKRRTIEGLKSLVKEDAKRSVHLGNIKDSLFRRIVVLEEIMEYPTIVDTWRGRELLKDFNLKLKAYNLTESQKKAQNFEIKSAIENSLSDYHDRVEKVFDNSEEIHLLIDDKKKYYNAGKTYHLDFLLFKTVFYENDKDLVFTTEIGDEKINWEGQPYITNNIDEIDRISTHIKDVVTGGDYNYSQRLRP